MFINTKNIAAKALTLISAAALTLSSCVQLGEEQDGAYGYLTITGFDVNVQVEQLVPTKGADGETTVDILAMIGKENMPELSEVTVIPKTPQEGGPDYYTWKVGETLKLPRGVYTLLAECGENGFETPWFEGTGEVEVIALDSVEGKVVFTLANSVMKVTNGMTDHFTVADETDVTISSTDNDLTVKSITTKMNNNTTDYVFVPSGKALYVKVTGSNTAGGESKEYSVGITADKIQKGYAHNVILSVDEDSLPSVNFGESNVVAWGNAIFITSSATATSTNVDMNKVKYYAREVGTSSWTHQAENNIISGLESDKTYEVMASVGALSSVPFTPSVNNIIASAKHTDTNGDASGGDLNGTDLKIDEASIPYNVKSNCTFTLNNSNGDTIHSFTSLQFVGADATDGWPYLPQGQYTLIATATVNGKEISSMTTIKVPAPSITPTVSLGNTSYTSYDKYAGPDAGNGISKLINGDKSQGTIGANDCQPETLYAPSVVIGGIHTNLLTNSNYSRKIVFYLDPDSQNAKTDEYSTPEISGNTFRGKDFTSLSWGSHTLTASFIFEGISATFNGSKIHHITGLPYKSPDFLSNSITLKSTSNASDNDWVSIGNVEYWKGRGYQLMYYYLGNPEVGSVFSPKFKVPQSTNVKYESSACFFSTGIFSADVTIYSGVATSFTKSTSYSKVISRKKSNSNPGASNFSSFSHDTVLDSAARISIGTDESKDGNGAENWVTIRYLNVSYR